MSDSQLGPIGAILALVITAVIGILTAVLRHRGRQVQEARVERDKEKERADHLESEKKTAGLTDEEAKSELDKILGNKPKNGGAV